MKKINNYLIKQITRILNVIFSNMHYYFFFLNTYNLHVPQKWFSFCWWIDAYDEKTTSSTRLGWLLVKITFFQWSWQKEQIYLKQLIKNSLKDDWKE